MKFSVKVSTPEVTGFHTTEITLALKEGPSAGISSHKQCLLTIWRRDNMDPLSHFVLRLIFQDL